MPEEKEFESGAFSYEKSELRCEQVALTKLAEKFGTPLYVYAAGEIATRVRGFGEAFDGMPHTIGYSVKANSNLSLLKLLAGLGCGFDVVSGGELQRVRVAAPKRVREVVFSGVGKQAWEIDLALSAGILLFNMESEAELELIASRARALRKKARVGFRVNPDVDAETHPYISTGLREHKFGVDIHDAPALYRRAAELKWLEVAGVSCHIGSQIRSAAPFGEAIDKVRSLVVGLREQGHRIRYVDAGGGLGIAYEGRDDFAGRVAGYATAVKAATAGLGVHLLLEPGRSIVGPSGVLLTRVLLRKRNGTKRFVVVDAAMNDLIRPSLYKAHHRIVPVKRSQVPTETVDVVGPVCETGDFLAHDREMPAVEEGELLAVMDAGAYGMSLASNYNTRGRAAEVLVDGKRVKLVRRRENLRYMLEPEKSPA